jgi:hypothetical protein
VLALLGAEAAAHAAGRGGAASGRYGLLSDEYGNFINNLDAL